MSKTVETQTIKEEERNLFTQILYEGTASINVKRKFNAERHAVLTNVAEPNFFWSAQDPAY